ncbi:MAG: AFG1 family ATPase [Cellvibrionaceae bacterium]|nr:AFG1 family ATPase [Cellvibrionaceae bacterium]
MTQTPKSLYMAALNASQIQEDAAQALAIDHLEQLHHALVSAREKRAKHFLPRWFTRKQPVRGLYFWGGVGRGKTFLMDLFFESLPFREKMRVHFHRFMRRVHQELMQSANQANPLEHVSEVLAAETCVICFDEFFVTDITDAMILANLLDALFRRGVCLVATSNIAPKGLYKDGLQRARFLPAIDLLQTHTLVLNIDGGTDYRLRALAKAQLFIHPLGEGASQRMAEHFRNLALAEGAERKDVILEIEGRPIKAKCVADDVLWIDFYAICDGPRSQNDYIELAREFQSVLIENIPALSASNDDIARRFINLVDEFYDRNVKLVISAAAPLLQLYQGTRLAFEFERTISRLQEMQSHEYLSLPHRP